jgi:WD40 repeat protein
MEHRSSVPRSRIAVIGIVLLIAGLSCLCLPGGNIPATAPSQEASPTEAAPPSVTQAPRASAGPLNPEAPWLLMETEQGLWAANPDGTGMTQITDVDFWDRSFQPVLQPMGNGIVYISPGISPGGYDLHNMALNMITLPDGHVSKITDLTSAQTEPAAGSIDTGDPVFEALRAIRETSSYAWSPDGTRLAFSGVMDGPSADIYIYDIPSATIRRIRQDEAQAFSPSWSPDGKHLVYVDALTFGVGAGGRMAGVWSADGDGGNLALLYAAADSGNEEIVGWLDNTTVVVDTWTGSCGSRQLRLVDVVSRKETMLSEDCVQAAVNPRRGEALFADGTGLYLLSTDDRKPVLMSRDPVAGVYDWTPDNDLMAVRFADGSLATFGRSSMDHAVSPVKTPSGIFEVADYGLIWAWTGGDEVAPGAWITGPGVEIGQIFTGMARFPIWDLHNNLLFFSYKVGGGYDIYRTTFDSHYSDLSVVASIDAKVLSVTWLGCR